MVAIVTCVKEESEWQGSIEFDAGETGFRAEGGVHGAVFEQTRPRGMGWDDES